MEELNKEKEKTNIENNKESRFKIDFKSRFSSFTWNHYLLLSLIFIFMVVSLSFFIGMSVSISKGLTLFGGGYVDSEDPSKVGSFDYVMLVIFLLLSLMMIFLFVYYLLFSKVKKIPKVTKEIIHGKIVDLDEAKIDNSNKSDK